MGQEMITDTNAPQGGLFRAWTDALIHPKFETYARWYPLMQTRWRRISLAVSLLLILVTTVVHILIAAVSADHGIYAYFASPLGLFRAFFWGAGSVVALFAMPAVVAWIANPHIGSYRMRFRVAFGTWMHIQPTICVLLLLSTIAQLFLTIIGVYDSTSFIAQIVTLVLVVGPAGNSWRYSCQALAAGSGRGIFQAGLAAAIPGILIYALFWFLLSGIFGWLGHPVV